MENNRNKKNSLPSAEKGEKMRTVAVGLNSKTGGLVYSAAAVGVLVFSLIITLIITGAKITQYSDLYWCLNFMASPLAIAAAVGATLAVRKVPFKHIFPVKCHPKYYLIGLLIVFGMFCSLNQINGLILQLFGKEPTEHSIKLTEYIMGLSGGRAVLALLIIAVLPAIFEELLFRGVMLNCCREEMGGVKTIFIVGFTFSLMHGNLEQTVYQFIAGCLFAFVAVRSRSILPCILMHFINNALTVFISLLGGWDESGNLSLSAGGNIALIVVGALVLAGGIIWLVLDKKSTMPKVEKEVEKNGIKNFFIFASGGIAVFGILWILSAFGVA